MELLHRDNWKLVEMLNSVDNMVLILLYYDFLRVISVELPVLASDKILVLKKKKYSTRDVLVDL